MAEMTGLLVSAAVLAGGESRRFGADKALVSLPGGTTPMLGAVVRALLDVTPDVTIIAPETRAYARFGVPIVSEAMPGQGPLGAISMALQRSAYDRCIVVACDLPFLNPDLLRWMCQLDISGDALVPMISTGDDPSAARAAPRPQPLHAVYHRSCLEAAQSLMAAGERRLGRLLDVVDVHYVDEAQIRLIDPALRSFVNVNSEEEWVSALRSLAP